MMSLQKTALFCDGGVFFVDRGLLMGAIEPTILNHNVIACMFSLPQHFKDLDIYRSIALTCIQAYIYRCWRYPRSCTSFIPTYFLYKNFDIRNKSLMKFICRRRLMEPRNVENPSA
jgi:hypothetical protein